MFILEDGVLAVLAAIGLASLVWLAAGMLLRPRRCAPDDTLALITARGSAETLEQSVRALVHLRTEEGAFSRIVILDRGMDEEAKARARILCCEYRGVELAQNIDT